MRPGVLIRVFALVLIECSASIRGQNRSDENLAVEEDGVSSALPTDAVTTIFSASSTSSSVVTESVMDREQATRRQMVQPNSNDDDGNTSYQNATVSSEMENREVSKPLSRDEIIQQGFANVTQKLEEIRCILSPFSIISGTLFLGHQIIRFTKYVYHKVHDPRPADDE